MWEAWGRTPCGSGLGYYPGVELKSKESARVPFPHKEVDRVALHGSNLVLAECKESTEHLNWLLRQEVVTAPIIGARSMDQLEDNLGATGWELSEEQVARLSEVSDLEDVYPYRYIREAQRV